MIFVQEKKMPTKYKNKILELADVTAIVPQFWVLKIISHETAKKSEILFFGIEKKTLLALTTNKSPELVEKVLTQVEEKWYKHELYYTDDDSYARALGWYEQMNQQDIATASELSTRKWASGKQALEVLQELFAKKETFSEWDFIKEVIRLSFQYGSSDLHFQPQETTVDLRLRRDWILQKVHSFSHSEFRKYSLRLKHMTWTKLNIDYLPQDWRFDFECTVLGQERKIDVRVSFMPWFRGEAIVMRFLDASKSILWFGDIWFNWDNLALLQSHLQRKSWIIIVTWPTGSWKTTTLYSMLNYLNDPSKKIITLEDPVEYELNWIQQSQINPSKGYNYEDWLKAILRQDPDIIMVWEIRTLQTAEIAINAALTWHLVISTMHTNTAVEAVSRMINMWIKPYMLAPALNLVVGQRLLRKLHNCTSKRHANIAENEEVKDAIKKIQDVRKRVKLPYTGMIPQPTGCEECGYDGYKWRIAAMELFDVHDDVKQLMLAWKSWIDLLFLARQTGFLTMKEDAMIKMLDWLTTLEEIRRVL